MRSASAMARLRSLISARWVSACLVAACWAARTPAEATARVTGSRTSELMIARSMPWWHSDGSVEITTKHPAAHTEIPATATASLLQAAMTITAKPATLSTDATLASSAQP